MVRHSKPREGSKAYWPRKRARRIYPRMKRYPKSAEARPLAFAGYKAAMTHAIVVDNKKGSPSFGQEISIPVTVIDCPPLFVVGIRAYKMTPKGLMVLKEAWSNKIPKEIASSLERKVKVKDVKTDEKLAEIEKALDTADSIRIIVATQPKLAAVGKKRPEIFEVEVGGKDSKEKFEFSKSMLGKEIKASESVKEGELVDVIAITTGKGTVGPVKRFGIKIQNRHAKGKRRHTGTLGQERPGKVRPTVPMAGQMGMFRRTEMNKRILKIGSGDITPSSGFNRYGIVKGDYIIIEGSVSGPKKRLVFMRPAIRPRGAKVAVKEVKRIVK
jgi:large subunit ribosomal protein L3